MMWTSGSPPVHRFGPRRDGVSPTPNPPTTMKSPRLRVNRVHAVLPCLLVAAGLASADTSQGPTGQITASSSVVRAGGLPTLTWNIDYPSNIDEYVEVEPPGTIVPKERIRIEIRALGAGVTSSSRRSSKINFVHTEGHFSYNNGDWDRLFAGTNPDVQQNKVLFSDIVEDNTSLRFGGRYYFNRRWSRFYNSSDGTTNIRVLKNGDTVPTTYNVATAPTLEDFIKPYLDASGKVRIGPMDMIVMMELTHGENQRTQVGYDLQDMVFLVTFKPL